MHQDVVLLGHQLREVEDLLDRVLVGRVAADRLLGVRDPYPVDVSLSEQVWRETVVIRDLAERLNQGQYLGQLPVLLYSRDVLIV